VTTASVRTTSARTVNADALVVGVRSDGDRLVVDTGDDSLEAPRRELATALKNLHASAKVGEVTKLPSGGAVKAPVIVAVGLGSAPSGSSATEAGDDPAALETLRRAAGAAARALSGSGTVAIALPTAGPAGIQAVVEGALLGGYAYDRYLATKHEPIGEVAVLSAAGRSAAARTAAEAGVTVAAAVNYARDLVNMPPNDLYPASFADDLKAHARGTGVRVAVTDEKALEDKGYGGIMGVGKGSARPPRLVRLTYNPPKSRAHLAFVGKGITFDSGGLSIKPAGSMQTMKCDMSGAAAVASATFAIAALGLPVRVTTYACLAENMPSGRATRPGDVLTMYGGKTVEVLNTDAEGRLVLADGITTANAGKPDVIVDVATLTGACVVALGTRVSGVLSNDDALLDEIPALAASVGENMWPLPIPDEMSEKVHTTKIADLSQHNPEPWGGALFAAAFLREFVADGIAWAHLDIAGPAFNEGAPHGYTPKGGTGTAVRTLVALARSRA
jgi:leucyl aminopeptidase